MARCLIVGCGCRGAALGRALQAQGHAIRATTRRADRADALRAEGFDAVLGDPDRVMTLAPALDGVGVLCILLGSAEGEPEALRDLHAGRLDMLLLRALDSTVRGIVYEAAGSSPSPVLDAGRVRVGRFCEGSRIPHAFIDAHPAGFDGWLAAGVEAVGSVLGG